MLSLSLPYEGTIAMTFNSKTTVGNGFLKVVFADNSGSANGLAMKPWEISGSAEHVALEIQKEIVNNVAYARYVIAKADAVLAVVADKAAAKAFSDKIAALNADYTTITGENVGNAKADVARLREEYDSLPKNVKAYVTDYGDIETVEIRIDEFERQQNESSGSQSKSQTEQSSAGAASSESTQSAGCLGSLSGASLAALFALTGVALLKKKND